MNSQSLLFLQPESSTQFSKSRRQNRLQIYIESLIQNKITYLSNTSMHNTFIPSQYWPLPSTRPKTQLSPYQQFIHERKQKREAKKQNIRWNKNILPEKKISKLVKREKPNQVQQCANNSDTETMVPSALSTLTRCIQLPNISMKSLKLQQNDMKELFLNQQIQEFVKRQILGGQQCRQDDLSDFQNVFPDGKNKQKEVSEGGSEQHKKREKKLKQKQNLLKLKEENDQIKQNLLYQNKQAQLIKVKSEPTGKSCQINHSTIAKLFYVQSYGELCKKEYIKQPDEDPFFFEAFKFIVKTIKTELVFPAHEANNAKIRTFIIRKILEDYVSQKLNLPPPEQKNQLLQSGRRLTKKDRQNYLVLNLEPPKSRIQKSYVQQLFKDKDFKLYYVRYITSDRFRKYMIQVNNQHIIDYQLQLQRIQALQQDTSAKMQILQKISARPFVMANINQYDAQSRIILNQYS